MWFSFTGLVKMWQDIYVLKTGSAKAAIREPPLELERFRLHLH